MIANADLMIFILIFTKFFRKSDMMYNIYDGTQLMIRTLLYAFRINIFSYYSKMMSLQRF